MSSMSARRTSGGREASPRRAVAAPTRTSAAYSVARASSSWRTESLRSWASLGSSRSTFSRCFRISSLTMSRVASRTSSSGRKRSPALFMSMPSGSPAEVSLIGPR